MSYQNTNPMLNQNARNLELMAMQSLLPGLTVAVERSIELLNEARGALALPLVMLQTGDSVAPKRRGRPPGRPPAASVVPPPPEEEPGNGKHIHEAPASKKQAAKARRKMTAAQRQAVGEATRARWDVVREAGIKPKSGSPSNAEVERALRIIQRKSKKSAAA
jgi:hypothetical protein